MPESKQTKTLRERFLLDRLPFIRGKAGRSGGSQADGERSEDKKGSVIASEDPRLRYIFAKLQLETARLDVYDDCWTMLNEHSMIGGYAEKYTDWVTAARPNLIFMGTRRKEAEGLTEQMLDETKFFERVGGYLWKAIFLGDFFGKKQYAYNPDFIELARSASDEEVERRVKQGMVIGKIAGEMLDLPAHTMVRRSNHQDRFDEHGKAFVQVLEDSIANYMSDNGVYFSDAEVQHWRFNHQKQKYPRYGRSALYSVRQQFNRSELGLTDMVVSRHLRSADILVWYLGRFAEDKGESITSDDIEAFYDEVIKPSSDEYSSTPPGTSYETKGTDKLEAVGNKSSLASPDDVSLQLEVMMGHFFIHPVLWGFSGGQRNVSGDYLEKIVRQAELAIARAHTFIWEHLQALIMENLWLNGIFTVRVDCEWPPPNFDSRSIVAKRRLSEVESWCLSRRSYHEGVKRDTWDEERAEIKQDLEDFPERGLSTTQSGGDVKKEDMDKGRQGKPSDKKPPENQPTKPDGDGERRDDRRK